MPEKNEKKLSGNIVVISFIAIFVIVLTAFCIIMQYSLIISLLLLFLGIHLSFYRKANIKTFLNMGLLLMLILFVSHVVSQYSNIPSFYIPVAAVSMLTILLFNDLQLSFVMAFASSILISLVLGSDFGMMLIFFIGSLTGIYSVRGARTRGQLIGAGLFVSVVQLICLVLLYPDPSIIMTMEFSINKMYPLAASGFIAVFFVMATLKIFEYLFGVLTNFSLLELADFDQPLLKRMILESPGTYQHSLVVGNLGEAAANAIGANALLTRVGAYYHDVGKMGKPEYFVENQLMCGNRHDNIEPSISRLVILNHVKEGIELAKKNKLNPIIIDFIAQHHGTSLVYYFYQKALEDAAEGEQIHEENFRYPGPKPQTRESAITLLADSVEGAVRSLNEANLGKIEETVKKVINNKFIDGQLDECNLTLKEIEEISSTFIRILGAMYHGRAKYPEKKNGNNSQKSAEKTSSQSSANN